MPFPAFDEVLNNTRELARGWGGFASVSLEIAESAGRRDVGEGVLPAVLPCSQVFPRQLVPPDTSVPKPLARGP